MIDISTLRGAGLALALGLGLAACAQQQPTTSQVTPASGGGMQGHSMSGMNMQQMMAHCAEMRQQRQTGAAMSPDMRAMMAHCDQMSGQPATGAAPSSVQPRR